MKRLCQLVCLIQALFWGSQAMATATAPGQWKAGLAKVAITPEKPVWMAGYASRSGPSQGKLVDIYARALVLSDGLQNRLVIVTLDLIEIPDSLRKLLLEVTGKHGFRPEQVLLNVSHTHGGPMVSSKTVADWGVDPVWGARADEFVREVVAKVDGILTRSIGSQAVVNVSYTHARCGFAMNRRMKSPEGFRLGPNPDGPVDHDVPVLRITNPENQLVGVVFGYACHNTALGATREIHGDFAGFAQQKLESEHPAAVALYMVGCGGDQDPSPRRDVDDARQNGLALASAVDGALSAAGVALEPSLQVSLKDVPLSFAKLPAREELQARSKSGDGFVARHARMILKNWPNAGDQPPDYAYPVQVLVFGDRLTLVALGGEPTVDYALRLKKELRRDDHHVWVAGYSNLVNAYIPSRRVLEEGGYEGNQAIIYQALPAPFQPDLEEKIVGAVHAQVKQLQGKIKK